jgi:predicted XRE-type DNA-binding protein
MPGKPTEKKTRKTASGKSAAAIARVGARAKATARTAAAHKTINGVQFVEGSDNVFRDLGFPEAEAVNLEARSTLMIIIKCTIETRGLTQAQAAKLLGVQQPRVSALYRGKIDEFTVDMLMKWLAKLGKRVVIDVQDVA